MDLELRDKVAVVTGARQGIGKGIVLGLAMEGAKVAFCDIKEEGAQEVIDEVKKLGMECMFTKTDVTDFDQVQEMTNAVTKKFGKIDILINNAGTVEEIPFHKSTPKVWQLDIDTSMIGARFTAYAAAKAGMVGLTRALAVEYGRYGIATNAVGPGYTLTEMASIIKKRDVELESSLTPEALAERNRWTRYRFPMGRWNEIDDVVKVVILLSSATAMRFVNGEYIIIDGGFTKVT